MVQPAKGLGPETVTGTGAAPTGALSRARSARATPTRPMDRYCLRMTHTSFTTTAMRAADAIDARSTRDERPLIAWRPIRYEALFDVRRLAGVMGPCQSRRAMLASGARIRTEIAMEYVTRTGANFDRAAMIW